VYVTAADAACVDVDVEELKRLLEHAHSDRLISAGGESCNGTATTHARDADKRVSSSKFVLLESEVPEVDDEEDLIDISSADSEDRSMRAPVQGTPSLDARPRSSRKNTD
jgi:hypothetical protein